MKRITSRTNPLVKHVVSLHHSKYRTIHDQFIAEGIRVVQALIGYGISCITLFVTADHIETAKALGVNDIAVVPPEVMSKISVQTSNPGILGVFAKPAIPAPQTLTRGVVLAQMIDPGNIGTLIRTSAALACKSVVVIEGSVDPWSPKVVHATAGTIAAVTIFEWSWDELVNHKGSLPLYALVVDQAPSIDSITTKDCLLVIGNEAHGIPPTWLQDCDARYTIPMPGKTESLNAAVAGSIALYLTICD